MKRKTKPPKPTTSRSAVRQATAAAAPAAPHAAARIGAGLVAATLALPSFIVLPAALDPFRQPQRLAGEWLALASIVALAAVIDVPWRRALARPAARVALPLLAVAVVGLAFTTHRVHVLDGLVDLAIGVAALVVWSLALAQGTLRRALDALLVPAAVLAVVAILQLHHLWQPIVFAETLMNERQGVTSFAGNPGDLAAFLVLPLLVAQAGIPGARGGGRAWRLAVALLCAYGLVGSQTLTSIVAAAAGTIVLWGVQLPRRKALLLAAGGAVTVALVIGLVVPLRTRLVMAWRSSSELNTLLTGRLDGWRVAVRLLEEHPLAGVGLGAYRAEFAAAKLELLREGVPFFAGHMNPSFSSAHDEYLELASELGWPGLLALAWGIAALLRTILARSRALPAGERGLAWGGLFAVALLALAYFPFRLGPLAFGWIGWLAWLTAGPTPALLWTQRARLSAGRAVLVGAATLALVGQTVRATHRTESSVLVRGVQLRMAVLGGARPPGPMTRAMDFALAKAHRLDPGAIEPLAFRADLDFAAGRLAEAESAYERAAAHEPRGETLFNWGLALAREGRLEEAAVQLRRGVELVPPLGNHVPAEVQAAFAAAPLLPIPPLAPPSRAGASDSP